MAQDEDLREEYRILCFFFNYLKKNWFFVYLEIVMIFILLHRHRQRRFVDDGNQGDWCPAGGCLLLGDNFLFISRSTITSIQVCACGKSAIDSRNVLWFLGLQIKVGCDQSLSGSIHWKNHQDLDGTNSNAKKVSFWNNVITLMPSVIFQTIFLP